MRIGIIGGTGLDKLEVFQAETLLNMHTPYGAASESPRLGVWRGHEWVFLPRHGAQHRLPPHLINYRANLWALKQAGVEVIIAFAAVGGIRADMSPATLVIPDQIIDYTYSRAHTFFEQDFNAAHHIDFTAPYDATWRKRLLQAGAKAGFACIDGATYGVTQGPRLETAAEIRRLQNDGCAIVGMTAMPEAALARELQIPYVGCAVVANWAAGKADAEITLDEIVKNLRQGMHHAMRLLEALVL